jgi:hypothetical protein
MNALLFIFMFAVVFQNQAFAKEDQKTEIKAVCEGTSSAYSNFNFACVLVDKPSNFDRNKAFLAIDKNGKPAIYPLFERDHRCIMLDRHSLTDILAHWTPIKVEDDVYRFGFSYWANGTWKLAQVYLQFRENYCSRFRVISDDTKMQSWLPAGAIPKELDYPCSDGTLKLPLFVSVVEGPRNMPDCSVRPIPVPYLKALREGKCPLGL